MRAVGGHSLAGPAGAARHTSRLLARRIQHVNEEIVEQSSGKTQRRRLNRGGDRQANAAPTPTAP
ncbi:hypothetical protein ACTVZO_42950 [Streptomyces sp. IBSNAI002]|uniref:hypothetical protein n=1 Tax=Streptomyces sp. IBSNAI002 TaxID=3457500 RepID=UPI003FD1313D